MSAGKYVIGALLAAIVAHFALVFATPRLLMNIAIERIGADGYNTWRVSDRVTAASRQIVRPSPDFAYSACAFDLRHGPVVLSVAPWDTYWSLSLYGANSDNFFVIDDREARRGVEITLMRRGQARERNSRIIESPSTRGIALIRRLAPTPQRYEAAREVAAEDVCARTARLVR
jgi:uncharacterized membrane protein